ncbi:NAD-dependent epimerase/dehydratase family protein [Pseudonocardia lacus]|uniref:NAD-dependent epimerase/dehydratase family protein n=1 Tax=Pseudonocardia lacus TaxID=2835865 RepID=UPI001BDCC9C2|nr:NAD-dependent epimerase/dehydratase family protein [Pseudonocardia lacus]
MERDLHVVVGATGGTGTALVHELRRRGHRVRAVNRAGTGRYPGDVEVVAADATDAAAMREVCAGAAAVHNCVNPPFAAWTSAFPAAVRGTIEGAAAAGARLVFADDTWMYGRVDAPMTESTPVDPVGGKGVLRAWLAEMVLAAHARGTCRTVVGRAGELYGPLVESVLGDGLFGAAVRGRPPRWIGALDRPLTPTYIGDFARLLATLGDEPDDADDPLLGRVWHVPHPAPLTGRELVGMVRAGTGTRAPLLRIGSATARRLAAVWPLAREGAELVYQFEMPFVVDGSAFAARFPDFAPTPWADGVGRTLAWYRDPVPSPDAAAAACVPVVAG